MRVSGGCEADGKAFTVQYVCPLVTDDVSKQGDQGLGLEAQTAVRDEELYAWGCVLQVCEEYERLHSKRGRLLVIFIE